METIHILEDKGKVYFSEDLHLSVSMRSFRAEKLSSFVKNVLDIEIEKAKEDFSQIAEKYPIVLTRDILKAKQKSLIKDTCPDVFYRGFRM